MSIQKNNYCLPIIKKTKKEVLQSLEAYKNEYAFLEVWLDYIEDLSVDFVDTLINSYEKQIIFLFRRQNLENTKMDKTLQQTLIEKLGKSTALVDFDVENQKELLTSYSGKHIIASYHNYTYTPPDETLHEILHVMSSYEPTMYKISTLCQIPSDALRLLALLLKLKKEKKRCIMLGMGEHGMITRVFGTLWGNEMIFAPQSEAEASAPGQLTKTELETILNTMQRKEET